MRNFVPSILTALTSFMVLASQAAAREHLLTATPAADTSGPAPLFLILRFSEPLQSTTSIVSLMKSDGGDVELTSALAADDPKTLKAAPKAPLTSGGYMVMWKATGSDGKPVSGDYTFTVR